MSRHVALATVGTVDVDGNMANRKRNKPRSISR